MVEEPGGRTVLYNYRPLHERVHRASAGQALRALPSFDTAVDALGSGAENYLRTQATGAAAADSEPALAAMLERIYADATSFEFPEERFERVYSEVERALFQNTLRTAIVAPLHGFEMEHDRLDLGDGLFLIAGDKLDAPAAAVWSTPSGEVQHGRRAERAVRAAPRRRRRRPAPDRRGARALPPAAHRAAPLQARRPRASGRSRGRAWTRARGSRCALAAGVGTRAACRGCSSRRRGPSWSSSSSLSRPQARRRAASGWALDSASRWAASGRATRTRCPIYLLALESLLDAPRRVGPRDAHAAGLAALCAEEGERSAVQRRAELAFALERWVMGGGGANAYLEALGPDTPRTLVLDLEQHLRALLRDVMCGYLGSDLKAAADDVLLTSNEPLDIKATDTRRDGARA